MTTGTARLPRGRHSLSREEVAHSQRARLVRAMADVMAEKGYARTSVADIVRAAHVSRESFYERFASKEDCFMSAFEEAYGRLVAAAAAEPQGAGAEPFERFERALGAYLEALAADPAYARVFLLEVHAAGAAAVRRRAELQQGLAAALARAMGVRGEQERFAIEAVLAAVAAMATMRLAVGDVDGLRALHGPLVAFARGVWEQ